MDLRKEFVQMFVFSAQHRSALTDKSEVGSGVNKKSKISTLLQVFLNVLLNMHAAQISKCRISVVSSGAVVIMSFFVFFFSH